MTEKRLLKMAETKLIVDGHVHCYSCYNPDKFFDAAIKNLDSMLHSIHSRKAIRLQYYYLLKASKMIFSPNLKRKISLRENLNTCLNILKKIILQFFYECSTYLLYPVRYTIVTREKLEDLSIASNRKIEDGILALLKTYTTF